MRIDGTTRALSKRRKRHLLFVTLALASGCQAPAPSDLSLVDLPARGTALPTTQAVNMQAANVQTAEVEATPVGPSDRVGPSGGNVTPVGFHAPVIAAPQQNTSQQNTSQQNTSQQDVPHQDVREEALNAGTEESSEGNQRGDATGAGPETAPTFHDFLLQGSGQSSAVETVPLPLPNASEAESPEAETPAGLTLGELEAAAGSSHPALAEARADIEAARGQLVQAGLPFNPVLQYQSEEIGNEGASGMHKVNVAQTFVTANKLGLARQLQAQRIEKRVAELQFAQLQILTRVRTMFVRTLVAQRRAEITAQIVDLAEQSLNSVEALLQAQEVSRIELLQARVEVEQARIDAANATTQLENNRRGLAAAAAIDQLPPEPLIGDLDAELTDTPWETLMARINAVSPEVAANNSELQRARAALQLAYAQVVPNIIGEVGVGVDAASDDTFGIVGVSVPLPIRNRNQGNIRTARANIAAAAAAIDRTQYSLEARLAEVLARYRIARERYQRLRDTVIPDAEETLELSRTAFNAGESSFLQLLTAQRTLFATRLSALDSVVQAREALAEIEGVLVTLSDSPGDAVRTPQSLGTGGGMGQGQPVARGITRRN